MSRLNYYLKASYRRKMIDRLLAEHDHLYSGRVMDIGGKDRGKFVKPRNRVNKWFVVDITASNEPDLLADVCDLSELESEQFDVVNATELFEHVSDLEKGLRECVRVLKQNGIMIISMPFLFPIHADPSDFQRWTEHKWRQEAVSVGLEIQELIPMGRYFTVLADMWKTLVRIIPVRPLQWVCYLTYPLCSLLVRFDDLGIVRRSTLGNYTTGYFIVCRKK